MPVSQTVKKSTCNARDLGFNSWVGKILWRRAWQHTSCLENPHGQRSLGGYSPSVQFSSVAQLCLTLCNLMDCSTPGLPVRHHLPELGQVHAHQVSDAIQPSHPLSSIYVSYMNIYIYIYIHVWYYMQLCTSAQIILLSNRTHYYPFRGTLVIPPDLHTVDLKNSVHLNMK